MSEEIPSPGRVALATVVRPPVVYRSIKICLFVGTVLTAVNQGEAIMAGNIHWGRIVLTYLVPLIVSSYAAWGALREHERIKQALDRDVVPLD